MTYSSTNLRLTYDNNTNQWSYTEADYEYANPTPPTWSGYTSSDPDFEFAPEVPDTPTDPNTDPCPAGYIYDNTLKQCVPDPNYAPRQFMGEPTGRDEPDQPGLHIPSNEVKENWISNSDKIIPAGQEGAGKTGLQNYIDNLDDRGFTKVGDDGKLYFEKDNLGSTLVKGASNFAFGGFLSGEVDAKTNKIIQDLQRMGAIDSSNIVAIAIDENGEPILDYASDLEISTIPGKFGIYNYEPGTAATNFMPGNFTGVTGTTGVTAGVGESGFDTWTNYINAMMAAGGNVTTTGQENITSVTGQSAVDLEEEKAKKIAEKKQAEADLAKMDAMEKGQSFTDDKGDTYTKVTDNQTGGGGSQGYSFTPSDPKPVEDKPYTFTGSSGNTVTVPVGPRAGVMAPKPKPPGVHHHSF